VDAEITKHSNDVIMKAMAETFKDKTLKIFGLDSARITGVIPTVLPVLEVKENRTDYIFLLEDNTLLHLEFQTSVSEEVLKRFMLYDARLINKDERDVNTAVIYSGRIKKAPDRLKKGSITYKVANVLQSGTFLEEVCPLSLNEVTTEMKNTKSCIKRSKKASR